jgi:hypothetical protein
MRTPKWAGRLLADGVLITARLERQGSPTLE